MSTMRADAATAGSPTVGSAAGTTDEAESVTEAGGGDVVALAVVCGGTGTRNPVTAPSLVGVVGTTVGAIVGGRLGTVASLPDWLGAETVAATTGVDVALATSDATAGAWSGDGTGVAGAIGAPIVASPGAATGFGPLKSGPVAGCPAGSEGTGLLAGATTVGFDCTKADSIGATGVPIGVAATVGAAGAAVAGAAAVAGVAGVAGVAETATVAGTAGMADADVGANVRAAIRSRLA